MNYESLHHLGLDDREINFQEDLFRLSDKFTRQREHLGIRWWCSERTAI